MKRLGFFAALVVAAISLVGGSAMAAGGNATKASVVYNSTIPNGPRSNLPSVGAEAYAFNQFGNEITLAGTARKLTSVSVTMSSWACVQGTWHTGDCSTPSGETFSQPITLNIYKSSDMTLIDSATQTFAVPYRPSASAKCTDGRWFQSSKNCFNGLAANVTFSFPGVTLPDKVVYGIVYNTSHFGPVPLGETTPCYSTAAGCPYDSLNIALSNDSDVSVGSSTSGTVWQNSPYASQYCDHGVTGTFRADFPCWTPYVPAVQFKAGL